MEKQIYSVKIQSVNKALDLLRAKQASKAAKKYEKVSPNTGDKTALHCSSSKLHTSRFRKRRKVTPSGFSRTLVAIEMRKCLMRHDWPHIAELLPLLLEGRLETEPILWRYLITQLLYSPKGTPATLSHFLDMCVGSQSSEFLKQVLTLPSQTTDSDST